MSEKILRQHNKHSVTWWLVSVFIDIDIDNPKQSGMKDVQFCEENNTRKFKIAHTVAGKKRAKITFKKD